MIADAVLNRSTDNTSSSSEEKDEQLADENVSLEKWINLAGKLISAVQK